MTNTRREISHYRLLECLGRGGMGEVWLAEDRDLPRRVAIKLLPAHLAADPQAVDKLLREARTAATVDHPGVVTVYEAGVTEERPYLVMQHVEGETLEKRIARGPVPIEEAIEIASRIADALAEVHALGIVHRDLKPANVVLTERGPKVLDFGIASVKGSPSLTVTGTVAGSPLVMSPEQIRGQAVDNRSDLWALGIVLYEMVTGVPPFRGETLEEATRRIVDEDPAPPRSRRPEVPVEVEFLVLKLLRKDPAQRYGRAEDVVADLSVLGAGSPSPRATPIRAAAESPRIAVLYFEVLGGDADDGFLAAGLTDDLIVDLARLENLRVASRSEVLPYQDRPVPPRTLAREIGVSHVVMGTIRRAGDRVRINAQLVRAGDGQVLWAERFDRTLEDLFEVQEQVSRRIVESLQVALAPREGELLGRSPTRNAETYELYLRARRLIDTRIRADNFRAEELLRRTLELDPEFALAHAGLGDCLIQRVSRWWSDLSTVEPAMAAARRALEIEADLFEAELVLGLGHRFRDEPARSIEVLEALVARAPEHIDALEGAAFWHLSQGSYARSAELGERVLRLSPEKYTTMSYLASAYEGLEMFEEAERVRARLLERLMRTIDRNPDDSFARSLLAVALAEAGETEKSLEQIARSLVIDPEDRRNRYNAACALAQLGMADRAVEELRRATEGLRGFLTDWPKRDTDLKSLHRHPGFIELFGPPEETDTA